MTTSPPVCGDLWIEYRNDSMRKRAIRVARLCATTDLEEDMLPPLEDAELVGMSPVAFTLSGVERLEGVYFAQTWLVRLPPAERAIDPTKLHPAERRRRGL